MSIFLKIPAWRDRKEQFIEQPWLQELPKLNIGDYFKVNGELWQWHHIEYDCDDMSIIIVLHTHSEATKETLFKPAFRQETVEFPDDRKVTIRF